MKTVLICMTLATATILTGCGKQPLDLKGRLNSYGIVDVLITEPVNKKCGEKVAWEGVRTDGTLSVDLSGCATTSGKQDASVR